MKIKLTVAAVFVAVLSFACDNRVANSNGTTAKPSPTASTVTASPTPVPTSTTPKNGDYPAKGVVTKINLEQLSIELDHEEIKGVMPPMRMEFFVTEKKLLDGLKVGDKIDFMLRYKDHTETIVDIKKVQ